MWADSLKYFPAAAVFHTARGRGGGMDGSSRKEYKSEQTHSDVGDQGYDRTRVEGFQRMALEYHSFVTLNVQSRIWRCNETCMKNKIKLCKRKKDSVHIGR